MTIETGVTGYTPESQGDKAISSLLNPQFAETVKYEGVYHIEVPPEVMDLAKEIEELGGRALLVGGSVRDAIMGIPPKDYDIEIYGVTPEQIIETLKTKFDSEPDMAGSAFEIIKWKIPSCHDRIDLSIPRRDSKVRGGRTHKDFVVTGDPAMSIADGSLRRDLTINSMAYDPLTETLYDPHGGLDDIKSKTIRVTDPETFVEDPLRVLRVMQFSARFSFEVAGETVELCKQMVAEGDLDFLTRERVAEEVMKLFSKGKEPSRAFEFARKIGFIEKYWPELYALINTPQNPDWHPEGDVWTHTMQVIDAAAEISDREIASGKMKKEDRAILIAAALCHDLGKPATTEFLKGAIRSYGHEEAGVKPAREFLERLFHDPKSAITSEFTARVIPLVAEHLKPKEMWINEVKKAISQKRALHNLSNRLAKGYSVVYPDGHDANIYLLSLLAEADQRGRNVSGHFSTREEVPELEEWQSWLNTKMNEENIEKAAPPKILKASDLLKEVGRTDGGPWVGIIINAVQNSWLDGEIKAEEAVESGKVFYEKLLIKIAEEMEKTGKNALTICSEVVLMEDPRSFLQ